MRAYSAFALGVVTSTLCAGVAFAQNEPEVNPVAGQVNQPALDARADFLARNPGARFYESAGRIGRVYGTAMSFGDDALQSAEAFRLLDAGLFGVSAEALRPVAPPTFAGHVQPVMFDANTGTYKFTLVFYSQYLDEWPVYRADLRLLVRNEPTSPVVLAASSLRDLGGFGPAAEFAASLRDPEYIAARHEVATAEALKHTPGLLNFGPPEIVVWAGIDDMVVAPTMAMVFDGDNTDANGVATERVRFISDVQTGAVLHVEPLIHNVDVTGVVRANASVGPSSEQCTPVVQQPMPYAAVVANGNTVYADIDGNYTLSGLPAGPVTVESPMSGQWFTVSNFQGTTETLSQNVNAPAAQDFLHNFFSTGPIRAQVQAYISANQVRDAVIAANPAYPTLSEPFFPIVVNRTDGFCPGNAWYDQIQESINFCLPGLQYPNTAWSSVVFHEYGHHLVQSAGSGQGQYGEGTGDVMSVLLLDDPRVGLGFFGPCDQTLRNAVNNLNYPCATDGHACAPLISGCVWEVRNALVVTEPVNYREILTSLAVNSILLHSGTNINPQITIDYLVLDDNDASISNGTPHFCEICEGFGEHNMDCPPVGIEFGFPEGIPATLAPGQATTINIQLDSGVQPEEVTAFYRSPGHPYTEVALSETSPGNYAFVIPPQGCPNIVQFYFAAEGGCVASVDPAGGAAAPYVAIVGNDLLTLVDYNFEANPGWTVSGVVADGAWNRGVPVDCDRGDPPADGDGSGQCWLTDNSAAGGCNSDVDDGTTILTSQIFDLSGATQPIVRYKRWFSNATGSGPQNDRFMVEISTNGGGSWSSLETVGPASNSPIPDIFGGWIEATYAVPASGQFRIRFLAEDINVGSIVEAGVDAFKIFDVSCESACPGATGDLNGDAAVDGLDVSAFVTATLNGPSAAELCAGDFSTDGSLTDADVAGFVAALLGP